MKNGSDIQKMNEWFRNNAADLEKAVQGRDWEKVTAILEKHKGSDGTYWDHPLYSAARSLVDYFKAVGNLGSFVSDHKMRKVPVSEGDMMFPEIYIGQIKDCAGKIDRYVQQVQKNLEDNF